MSDSGKDLYTIKLQISTNLIPQESIEVGNWKFEKGVINGREFLYGIIKIESEEYKGLMPPVVSQALDEIGVPLTTLAFCLDGVFRVNPHEIKVLSSKVRLPDILFYDDFRHTAFGRALKGEECKYVERIGDIIRNDEHLKQLLIYYKLGLDLSFRYYYPSEAFLNFYKIIELISWKICDEYNPKFKDKKEKELNEIAGEILKERRLDDSRHSDNIKINQIKHLIRKYISQKEITSKDQVEFTCEKLGLMNEIEMAKKLVEIRNKGGIAHSLKEQKQEEWLEELRGCRDLARKFILKYLISKGMLESENYSDFMQVPSGIH